MKNKQSNVLIPLPLSITVFSRSRTLLFFRIAVKIRPKQFSISTAPSIPQLNAGVFLLRPNPREPTLVLAF